MDGDTQLVDANLRPFAPHADLGAAEAARMAAAAEAVQGVGGAAGRRGVSARSASIFQRGLARLSAVRGRGGAPFDSTISVIIIGVGGDGGEMVDAGKLHSLLQ